MVTLEQILQWDKWFAASVCARLWEVYRFGEAVSTVSCGLRACRLVGQCFTAYFVKIAWKGKRIILLLIGSVSLDVSILDVAAVVLGLRVEQGGLARAKTLPFGLLLEDVEGLAAFLELGHEGLGGLFRAQ